MVPGEKESVDDVETVLESEPGGRQSEASCGVRGSFGAVGMVLESEPGGRQNEASCGLSEYVGDVEMVLGSEPGGRRGAWDVCRDRHGGAVQVGQNRHAV